MSKHDPEHEELLLAVLAGDVQPNAPEVRERTESCATCATRLARLRSVAQRLDAEAREEMAILALAEGMSDAPGDDRIAAFRSHGEFRRYTPARRTGRRLIGWTVAVAAAAVLLATAMLVQGPGDPPDRGQGSPTESWQPLGASDGVTLERFDEFDENLELHFAASPNIAADVARWMVTVDGTTADGVDIHESYPAQRSPWSKPSVVRELPDEIVVTVTALGADGSPIETSAPVTATRRR